MSKKAIILGNGEHARVIYSLISDLYPEIVYVSKDAIKGAILEDELFTNIDNYRKADFFIGIGNNQIRKNLFLKLRSYSITPANYVSANSFIAKNVELGDGVVICPGAVVMTNAKINNNVIINTLSSVDHDGIVGDHSQLAAGVSFGGGVRVGENCFLGIRSTVVPRVSIGDNVQIMAGSVVTRDVPSDVLVGGYPARVIKKLLDVVQN